MICAKRGQRHQQEQSPRLVTNMLEMCIWRNVYFSHKGIGLTREKNFIFYHLMNLNSIFSYLPVLLNMLEIWMYGLMYYKYKQPVYNY